MNPLKGTKIFVMKSKGPEKNSFRRKTCVRGMVIVLILTCYSIYGRRQSIFDQNDLCSNPCLYGITTGKTTKDEFVFLVDKHANYNIQKKEIKHPHLENRERISFSEIRNHKIFSLEFSFYEETVKSIKIDVVNQFLTPLSMRQVINELGPPKHYQNSGGHLIFVYIFEDQIIKVVSKSQLKPNCMPHFLSRVYLSWIEIEPVNFPADWTEWENTSDRYNRWNLWATPLPKCTFIDMLNLDRIKMR